MREACVLSLVLLCLELATGSLVIGAFNIQTFGDKKASNTTLVDIIVKIVGRFDVLLVQEVRDSDLSATNKLMDKVYMEFPNTYSYIVSEPLGTSSYKERYLFIYREQKVSVVNKHQFSYGSGADAFSRPPFVVMFSASDSGVNFVLIPQHTSPDHAVNQIDGLYNVVMETRAQWKTDNILLLGDFNAGCDYVTEKDWSKIHLWTDKSFHWLITNTADTTVSATVCPYDRIVATMDMNKYVAPGSAEVFNFMTAYKLSQTLAKDVSDHFPVQVTLSI